VRLGSLCTGYGGLDMAVEAHYGADLAWYSEIDKDCSQLLAHHWPTQPNLGDLTTVDWNRVDPVDIMCAGFPCQPFSHAGKREGENDDRAIFAYIADAVSVLRPGIVVLENVAGILTLGGPGVVGTLTGLGYDLRWGLVRASDAGAPHRRARWFCVATDSSSERHGGRQDCRGVGHLDRRDESQTRQRQRPRAEPVNRSSAFGVYADHITRWERTVGRPAPDPTDDRGLRPGFVEWMMGLPDGHVCGLGLSRTAELKMLGNGVCPQQAALALTLLDD
jgi:DNA (cytosine-5)-methyltransferase 1